MNSEYIDEELREMYEEPKREFKTLTTETLRLPLRQLSLNEPAVLNVGSTVQQAIEMMRQKHIGCIIITKSSKLVGILTERDLLMKFIGEGKHPESLKVDELMTPEPETLQLDDMIAFAMNMMHVGGYRHIPIVDDQNSPVAIVSVKDILDFLSRYFPQEVLNLPPRPMRRTESREGA
ncbi:MAG: CBS domain-containing protein [Bacteroidota bacterium]